MSMTIAEAHGVLNDAVITIPAGTTIGYKSVQVEGEWKSVPITTTKLELVQVSVRSTKFFDLVCGAIGNRSGRSTGGALTMKHVRGERKGGRS